MKKNKYKPLVAITRKISDLALEAIASKARIKINPSAKNLNGKELINFVKGADVIVSMLTNKISSEVIEAAGPQLKLIANYAVGYDNIDVKAAAAKNIFVSNTPGVLTEAVAEHTVALMLAVARRLVESDNFVRANKYKGWEPELLIGQRMLGKTIGILGLGRIGRFVAHICHYGFGMQILYYDVQADPEFGAEVNAHFVTMLALLKQSDVISLHVPLIPTTRHLISTKEFKLMKKSAILINTSRGPVIDEKALVTALRKNEIFGAGIDVYENEPRLTPGLANLPNVVLTPHTASATREARDEMAQVVANNVLAILAYKNPPNMVK